MLLKKFLYFLVIIIFFSQPSISEMKVEIEMQIGDDILTNIDFLKEQNYLIALNNNLKGLEKNQIKKIAKESLIREKIKKAELIKFYDFKKVDKYSDEILVDFYKRLNFNNESEFENYIKQYDLKISEIKEKLKIERFWNEMIYNKYKHQININEKEIEKKINKQRSFLYEYNLSEIMFELKQDESLNKKYDLILQNISNKGFKNSANIFGISDSSKFGGNLGWISQNQLNDIFLKELKNMKLDEITKPIQTGAGYLILKLNDKRKSEVKMDLKKMFRQKVIEERNRQLNQFSLIYFNKIKKNIFISEK